MNKIQAAASAHNHSHHHESEDNCDGCQEERRQNNMLVDFYERLNKIQTKVDKIKDNVTSQQTKAHSYRQRIQQMNRLLLKKPEDALKSIKQHDSKEMGYQLASALIEREIKTKMENQRLQSIIEQLQKDKLKLQEQKKHNNNNENRQAIYSTNSQKPHPIKANHPQSRYSDVIDEVRQTNDSSYFMEKKKDRTMSNSYFLDGGDKRYWEDAPSGQEETSFSNFTANNKQKNKSQDQHQYDGLNLWLYQFQPEQIDPTPIKSLRKPNPPKKVTNSSPKYKSNF